MRQLHTVLGLSTRKKIDMYTIQDDILFINGKTVEFYPTPNQSGEIDPKFLVIHFTAGSLDARGTAQYFQNPKAKTSAHLNLDVDGTVTQNVAFNRKAWHAGKSQWAGYNGLNSYSIGIEVCNPGPLTITNSGYKTWWGATVDPEGIVEAPHPNSPNGQVFGWLPFSQEQHSALIEIGTVLFEKYNLLECVGHDMIAPGRKTDPGPCMNHRVYDRLNSLVEQDETVYRVYGVKNYLNARSGPGTTYQVVGQLPLGEELEMIDRQGVWWFMEKITDGQQFWVHSRFLSK